MHGSEHARSVDASRLWTAENLHKHTQAWFCNLDKDAREEEWQVLR